MKRLPITFASSGFMWGVMSRQLGVFSANIYTDILVRLYRPHIRNHLLEELDLYWN